jgi:hypothetical protein
MWNMFFDRNAAWPIYCSVRHGYMIVIKASCNKEKNKVMFYKKYKVSTAKRARRSS